MPEISYWDIELFPDKAAGIPQNLTLVKRFPQADPENKRRRKKTVVSFAPPLLLHTSCTVHNILKIDSNNGCFLVDAAFDARLHSVAVGESDRLEVQEKIEEILTLYEVDPKQVIDVAGADVMDFAFWADLVEVSHGKKLFTSTV